MTDALTVLREVVRQLDDLKTPWEETLRYATGHLARLEREQAEAKREEELNDHGPCD